MGKSVFCEEFLDRYDAFYLMIRSAAVLGSQNSALFDRDAQTLIRFIGRVYGWREELTDGAADFILGDLMKVGLTADYLALGSAELLDGAVRDSLVFFEAKGRALEEVVRAEILPDGSQEMYAAQELRTNMSAAAFHHAYEPRVRFSQIKRKACGGSVLYALELAMMRILGIGCRCDIVQAQRILEGLMIWREPAAAKILAFLWAEEGDHEAAAVYESVFAWLDDAQPILEAPGASEETVSGAAEYCAVISLVHSMVKPFRGRGDVDFLFAGLMNSEEIPFPEKLEMIRQYREGGWLRYCRGGIMRPRIGFAP